MNDNLISDSQWAEWALELETLQNTYPELAKSCIYGNSAAKTIISDNVGSCP